MFAATYRGVALTYTNPAEVNSYIRAGCPYVFIEWIGGDFQTIEQRMLYQYKAPDPETDEENWSSLTHKSSVTLGLPNGKHNFSVRAILLF